MVIYKAKDYQDMSRKAQTSFLHRYYEAKLCTWTCNRIFTGRYI